MKKFLLSLSVVVCCASYAEYSAENKIIKVVIPQPAASGLAITYRHIEEYAKKHNITMIPVFKPGADGKIGISYASKEKNDGDTLLFSTISDYVNNVSSDLDFDPVAPITKVNLTLVASKKSKIKNSNDIVKQELENPGKLTWAYASSAQAVMINNFVKTNNIDINKIYKIPFNGTFQTSLVNGDVDIGFVLPSVSDALKDHITIVDIDEKTRQKMSIIENATGLFLPKNSTSDSNKFWNKFVNDLVKDKDFKSSMTRIRSKEFTDPSPERLTKIIDNWKL
jgi:tripartite-type tricarboxylate transporter receptor subunit TctC